MIVFTDLTPDAIEDVAALWTAAFPDKPISEALLAERLFSPPDYTPSNAIAVRAESGDLIAFAAIVPPPAIAKDEPLGPIGGIRAFVVHPSHTRKGIGSALLRECNDRLAATGAAGVDFICTPPYYLQPGIDTRSTGTIVWLTRRGFEHRRTIFNMTVELETLEMPDPEWIFQPDPAGYLVRRGREEDREEFTSFCRSEWGDGWTTEGCLGLGHVPSSLFLAVKRTPALDPPEEIVGFAVYEANQLTGCFGPTGVSEQHQGRGLGKRLLFATLADMKALGRIVSEIGWVGPVDFYWRAAGARLGPSFWAMRKILKSDSKAD